MELVELRGHFGVSASDALGLPGARDPLPAWEYDLLAEATRARRDNNDDEAPVEEPDDGESEVPEALRGI